MIVKILINFYRWLWGLKPLVVNTLDNSSSLIMIFGAFIDIMVIIGIVGFAIIAYSDRRKNR